LLSLSLIYFQPVTHFVLGRSLMARGEDGHAEQAFKTALGQMPGLVPAHSALARLYERRGHTVDATLHRMRASALLKARKERSGLKSKPKPAQAPEAPLAPIEERQGTAPFDPARDITIVAGLPRSGTSMLMQLLAAGGIEPLTDGRRVPDSDNPRGYMNPRPAWLATHRGSRRPAARWSSSRCPCCPTCPLANLTVS
jgi:hypothetical protein